jgi:hypothetical protein
VIVGLGGGDDLIDLMGGAEFKTGAVGQFVESEDREA